MNSVAMVRKLRMNRSPTENAPQNSPESLVDEPGVAHTGHRAQTDHHLLVHDEHGDQQWQGPQERQSEVLSRLAVGGHASGVVVPDHDDEPGPHDGQQRE